MITQSLKYILDPSLMPESALTTPVSKPSSKWTPADLSAIGVTIHDVHSPSKFFNGPLDPISRAPEGFLQHEHLPSKRSKSYSALDHQSQKLLSYLSEISEDAAWDDKYLTINNFSHELLYSMQHENSRSGFQTREHGIHTNILFMHDEYVEAYYDFGLKLDPRGVGGYGHNIPVLIGLTLQKNPYRDTALSLSKPKHNS